jgi:hypothetical protein
MEATIYMPKLTALSESHGNKALKAVLQKQLMNLAGIDESEL